MMKIASHFHPTDVRALTALGAHASGSVIDLVEAMHATIVRPFGMADSADKDRTNGITGFVYKALRGTTKLAATSLDLALSALPSTTADGGSSFERDAIRSALNGVLGDYLVASNNELAIPMGLCRDGEVLDMNRKALSKIPKGNRKLLIVIHGLCMNDRQWLRDGHNHAEALATELGYTPLYLRYNSGLHVSENGQTLSGQLELLLKHWPHPTTEISILAHSMGGLVARSAAHSGATAELAWIKHLKKIIFLGTPHHGAPLERGGRWLEVILGATPYAKPLARLGKIRSVGITDLRYGCVADADCSPPETQLPTALPRNIKCYAIAATTGRTDRDWKDQLLGDGLVPVASALGQHENPAQSLKFAKARQWVRYETNHMELLSDAKVFNKLVDWLK